MVSVIVVQPFEYRGKNVFPGESVEMEPIDAAVHSHAGHVSLLHGNTYQTRQMVAEASPSHTVGAMVFESPEASPQEVQPEKRKRGRPRKAR